MLGWLLAVVVITVSVPAVLARQRYREKWHVIERPSFKVDYDRWIYDGRLQVAIDRRKAKSVVPVGTCDFEDYETRAELVAKAEERAAHLNRVRNST